MQFQNSQRVCYWGGYSNVGVTQQHLHFNDQFKCQFQCNYPAERPTSLQPDSVPAAATAIPLCGINHIKTFIWVKEPEFFPTVITGGSRVTLFIFIRKVFLICQGVLPPTLNTPYPLWISMLWAVFYTFCHVLAVEIKFDKNLKFCNELRKFLPNDKTTSRVDIKSVSFSFRRKIIFKP